MLVSVPNLEELFVSADISYDIEREYLQFAFIVCYFYLYELSVFVFNFIFG